MTHDRPTRAIQPARRRARAALLLVVCLALAGVVAPASAATPNPPRLSPYMSGTSDTGTVVMLACQRRNPTSGNFRVFVRLDARKSRASVTGSIAVRDRGGVLQSRQLGPVARRRIGPVVSFVVPDRPGLRTRTTLASGSASGTGSGPFDLPRCG